MNIRSWSPFRLNLVCFSPDDPGSTASSGADPGGVVTGPSGTPDGGSASSGVAGSDSGSPSNSAQDSFEASFSGMDTFDSSDLDGIDLGDGATGTEPGAAPSEPQAQPAAQTPVQATPPAAPVQPAAQPQQVPAQQTPAAQAPSAPRSAREDLDGAVNDMKAGFKELVEWATPELFSLTKDEIEALDTNAVEMIPKLMARTYTQALLASMNMMRNFVPRMISEGYIQQSKATARATEAKNAFYQAWPELSPEKHDAAMNQVAKVFRQMNPTATRQQAIEFVGAALMAQFGLQRGARPTVSPNGQAAPARPAPFQPARPGGRQVVQTPVDDPYSGLDGDYLDSE